VLRLAVTLVCAVPCSAICSAHMAAVRLLAGKAGHTQCESEQHRLCCFLFQAWLFAAIPWLLDAVCVQPSVSQQRTHLSACHLLALCLPPAGCFSTKAYIERIS
jgi:hypothetical protein